MTEEQAYNLLVTAVNDLLTGDRSAISSLMRALQLFGLDLESNEYSLGILDDSVGIAIGNEISKVLIHEGKYLSNELEKKLSGLLQAITQRNTTNTQKQLVRIFISSPGDVLEERSLALRVIDNLSYKPLFRGKVILESIAWDKPDANTPLLATLSPQEAINQGLPKPSECDIAIFVFWSRMGTPLNEEYRKPEKYWFENESNWEDWRYLSGTEWEYIDALSQAEKTKRPLVAVYRRTDEPIVGLRDSSRNEKIAQYELVESFFKSFYDRSGVVLRGINQYKTSSEFEIKLGFHLQDLISRVIYEKNSKDLLIVEKESPPLWEGSPFPGLRSFGIKDAPIFVGREAETEELVERVSNNQFVVVVGASGSGKSSLVGAGLIPRIIKNAIPGGQDWFVVNLTPDSLGSGDPFASLIAAISVDPFNIKISVEELRENPSNFVDHCLKTLSKKPKWSKLLVVVDQFEELFTRVKRTDCEIFFELLKSINISDRIRVVITLRADFYNQALEFIGLESIIRNGTFPLYPPKRDSLRLMIEKPAERAGLRFETGLVRRILDDTGEDPGSLALLAFALQQLYSHNENGLLTHEVYEKSGGVQGSIGQQAQLAFESLAEEIRATFPIVFRELIEVSEKGIPTRRRIGIDKVIQNPACEQLINAFVEKRLLVMGRGEDNLPIVEVAHEALFTNWQTLRDWIADVSDDLVYGCQLSMDEKQWANSGFENDYLLHGSQLQRAQEWRDRGYPLGLVNDQQFEFINQSQNEWERIKSLEIEKQHREVKRLRLYIGLLSLLVVAIGIFAGLSIIYGQRSIKAETVTKSVLLSTQSQLELMNGNRTLSMLLAFEGLKRYPYQGQAEYVLNNAIYEGPLPVFTLRGHKDVVDNASWSPDGSRIATASWDNTAIIWNAESGKPIVTIDGHYDKYIRNISWSPDGRFVATAADDGTPKIWDASTGQNIITLAKHDSIVWNVNWSNDGQQVLSTSSDGLVKVWDVKTGELVFGFEQGEKAQNALWSKDGKSILSFSDIDNPTVHNASDGSLIFSLRGHGGAVTSAKWSPDGTRILTSSTDNTTKIWDSQNGALLLTLIGHKDSVNDATWAPDGSKIVTASSDNVAKIWDANSRIELFSLEGHKDILRNADWSPDGNFIVTASLDNTAKLWDANRRIELFTFSGHESLIRKATFSPDGRKILTSSNDKTARIWSVKQNGLSFESNGHSGVINSIKWSPNEKKFVTSSSDKTARVWDAISGDVLLELIGHGNEVTNALWSPDGERILTISSDCTARIWDANLGIQKFTLLSRSSKMCIENAFWSTDGKRILTINQDGNGILWDSSTGEKIITYSMDFGAYLDKASNIYWVNESMQVISKTDSKVFQINTETGKETSTIITSIYWHPGAVLSRDGQRMITTDDEGKTIIQDVYTGEIVFEFTENEKYDLNCWSPDNQKIISLARNDTAKIRNAINGDIILTINDVDKAIWSPDGNQLLTWTLWGDINIRKAVTGEISKTIFLGEGDVIEAGWSPDGTHIWTFLDGKPDIIWNAFTGKQFVTLNRMYEKNSLVTWSNNNQKVLIAYSDNNAIVWNSGTGFELFRLKGHEDSITNAAFSPDDKKIITFSSDGTVRIWDAENGIEIKPILCGSPGKCFGKLTKDGTNIITISSDKNINIWETNTGNLLHTAKMDLDGNPQTVSFSPDEKQVLTTTHAGQASSIVVMDILTGAKDSFSQFVLANSEGKWSPNGEMVLAVSSNNTVNIWDSKSGELIYCLIGHKDKILDVFWSPEGNRVLTYSTDKTARIWNIQTGKEVSAINGYQNEILNAAWAFNNDRVIITFSDQTGRMYDAVTGEELGKFSNKSRGIFYFSVSPSGNYLLTTSADGIPQISQAWSSWEVLQNQIEKCCYRPFSDDERDRFALH